MSDIKPKPRCRRYWTDPNGPRIGDNRVGNHDCWLRLGHTTDCECACGATTTKDDAYEYRR